MPISGFSDVDSTEPARLKKALARRAEASLYVPYRGAMLHHILAGREGLVVDVGAGGGHLVETVNQFRPAIGLDPSQTLVADALENGRMVILGDGAHLPFPSSSVGVVVAERVLQHVPNNAQLVDEMVRVTKPGGTIVVADPVHCDVDIVTGKVDDLWEAVKRWWETAGVCNPGAAADTVARFSQHQLNCTVETYVCTSGKYSDARIITNFPQWARLATEDGVPLGKDDVARWETFRAEVKSGTQQFTFQWSIQLTSVIVT